MTRQKKELIRRIEELEYEIYADEQLGCGFAPEGAYDSAYDQINEWGEELAHISHFNSYDDYRMDERGEFAGAGTAV